MSGGLESTVDYSVVVPTIGRPNLGEMLAALAHATGPGPQEVVVVDDRRNPSASLDLPTAPWPLRVVRSGGRGPATARNRGWRVTASEWVVFLDDDVVPASEWPARLADDLVRLPAVVAASQARIVVPLPVHRRPTDAERGTAGLARARWITADMAFRRSALEAVGGFDERFPRAYREDADLALRLIGAGYQVVDGRRVTTHPVAASTFLASVRAQRGNGDDVLMRRRHGRDWRPRIGEGPGRLRRHMLTTAAAMTAVVSGLRGKRGVAAVSGLLWAGCTAEFAMHRIWPGPRTADEVLRMLVTSVAIPPAACAYRIQGEWRHRGVRRSELPRGALRPRATPRGRADLPAAVLFDRDDTLIHDVPYNGDPEAVRPVPGAVAALARLRELGVPIGVVSNQSGVARGLITTDQLSAVNARIDELLGPFDTWQICLHGEATGCDCRKPAPGLIEKAAADLGVSAGECVVIGDIGADVEAARAAGARGILVPTARTLPAEIRNAPEVAADLTAAVRLALHERDSDGDPS
jgi:histidinol-phosphate phosphatase family protein